MAEDKFVQHVARKGESLPDCPARGISVKELAMANPEIKDPAANIEGQTVQYPCPVCVPMVFYTIQPGTPSSCWPSFGTTVQAIQQANPAADPNNLRIGQVICIPTAPAPPQCPNGFLTIRPGDTFFLLAQRFGTTVQAIQQANPAADPNNLRIGQVICIPTAPAPPQCPNGFLYTIRPGDTFFLLAQRFGTTVQAIQQANPGVNPDNLQVGQVICIPN